MPRADRPGRALRLLFLGLAVGGGALGLAAHAPILAAAFAGLAVAAGVFAELRLGRPLERLGRTLWQAARNEGEVGPAEGWCGDLSQAGAALRQRLRAAEDEAATALAAATRRSEAEKRRLAAILLDLSEGVIVCSTTHKVLLFNHAAAALLEAPHALGLGRAIDAVLSRAPLEPHLEAVRRRPDLPSPRFFCATAEGGRLLAARLAALPGEAEGALEGYVLTLGTAAAAAGAAVEIASVDLIALLARRAAAWHPPLAVVAAGLPERLLIEAPALPDLLERLCRALADECGVSALTVAATRADDKVWLDLVWTGAPVPEQSLAAWLNAAGGPAVLGRLRARCEAHQPGHGEAALRLTLPAPVPAGARRALPMRPEFYDFELAARPENVAALRERTLRDLDFVVFDVETTGLDLAGGDTVVSIGAVRVVNGRVRPLETFERLVDPLRPIPPESVRFHGVTDAAVAGAPPLPVVLAQFARFAGEAVLVAHNAAFDLAAIAPGARAAGLRFEQAVLDTLLISAWLDPEQAAHSLDAIAAREGIPITARHDALADALAEAAILVRQFERLEARGITRFGDLAVAIDLSARLRAHGRAFRGD